MDDGKVRQEIKSLLEGGLKTEAVPRADTPEQVEAISARLRAARSLKEKLVSAGFELQAFEEGGIEQECQSCVRFAVHRKFCEVPELLLPVEPEWSCRLWRL